MHFQESLTHFQELGHRWPLVLTLCDQAWLAWRQGHTAQSRELVGQALSRLREMGRPAGTARALAILGYVVRDEGNTTAACEHLRESISILRPRGDRLGIAVCLEGLAAIQAQSHQYERAARLLGAAAALREAIGAPLAPADRPDHERTLAITRAALRQDAFAATWAEGSAMPAEDAAADAVNACKEN